MSNEENKEQSKASLNQTNDSETTVRIEIDNDKRLTELQKSLEEKTAKIAVMEFERTHNSFGAPNAPKGGDTAPLNPPSDFKPSKNDESLMTKTYPNEFALYADLAKRSSDGDVEAQGIQRQLVKKLRQDCGGLIDVEFYGETKALYRQPKPITPDMNEFQRQAVKEFNEKLMLEKSKWRRVQ